MNDPLEKAIATYRAHLNELLPDEGKFVLVHGDTIVGVYAAYEDALGAGYEKFGIDPFLVRQIQGVEQVQYFTRDITCQS